MTEEGVSVNDDNPFDGLKISDKWTILSSLSERTVCSQCNKSRKYFCYTCYLPVPDIAKDVPPVDLPLAVDIIKHSKEIDGKSTAVHAAVICPKLVNIYSYPSIPNYTAEDEALLVFPGKSAVSVNELVSKVFSNKDLNSQLPSVVPFKKVILIDSTWNQCKGIYKDPRISGLPCVVLKKRITQFWRHQNGSPRWHLSTIEAVHQFFVEFHEALALQNCGSFTNYEGQYDNLLFFFRFMYYVHLSKAQPGWDVIPLEDDLTPEVRHTTCSGALIAAYIVQTACHCISKESHSREAVAPDGTKLNYIEHFYRAQDVFENPLYSFIGNTLITRLVNWHRPKHYSIHQNCRFLHALPAMYDQGFIILEETVPSRSNLAAISYAPLYRSEEMLRYHRNAIEQELTCLRIGHGLYRITSRDGGEVFNYDPNPSNSLRWGWRTLLNRYDCKYAAIRPEFRLIRYDYDSLSTCDCGQSPQHHLLEQDLRYSSGRGDSGGPIVCGNHLYGTIMGKV